MIQTEFIDKYNSYIYDDNKSKEREDRVLKGNE